MECVGAGRGEKKLPAELRLTLYLQNDDKFVPENWYREGCGAKCLLYEAMLISRGIYAEKIVTKRNWSLPLGLHSGMAPVDCGRHLVNLEDFGINATEFSIDGGPFVRIGKSMDRSLWTKYNPVEIKKKLECKSKTVHWEVGLPMNFVTVDPIVVTTLKIKHWNQDHALGVSENGIPTEALSLRKPQVDWRRSSCYGWRMVGRVSLVQEMGGNIKQGIIFRIAGYPHCESGGHGYDNTYSDMRVSSMNSKAHPQTPN